MGRLLDVVAEAIFAVHVVSTWISKDKESRSCSVSVFLCMLEECSVFK